MPRGFQDLKGAVPKTIRLLNIQPGINLGRCFIGKSEFSGTCRVSFQDRFFLFEPGFFNDLVEFMSSGPIVAAVLEKENAVEDFRTLIGATNPAEAAPGTIRAKYATSIGENAVHGADSDENAAIEAGFFFGTKDRF